MLKKVFNWSEVHLSEMTCYKIHTLVWGMYSCSQSIWYLVFTDKTLLVAKFKWLIDVSTQQNN